jgi:hypothetical protein
MRFTILLSLLADLPAIYATSASSEPDISTAQGLGRVFNAHARRDILHEQHIKV